MRLAVALAVTIVVACAPVANALPAPGGSNYAWYRVDMSQAGACNREPYGVIPNFGDPAARAAITSELAQMFAAGQRRLRINVYHGHGLDTGTIMDSTGGDLSERNRRNLGDLLAAIKAAGFEQVEVAFHPQGPAISEWVTWDQGRYEENWRLIRNLRPIIRAAGLPYRIDLSNEAIPTSHQPLMLRYSRRLWADYVRAFGRQDTVGFSLIPELDRVGQLRAIYGSRPPYTFDLHIYPGTGGLSESTQFSMVDTAMRALGFEQPWIVGEALYDDPDTAAQLASALAASRRAVYYLTQWPLTRGSPCADVNVGAPLAFDAYAAAGFDWLPETLHAPAPVLRARRLKVGPTGRVTIRIGCLGTSTRCFGTVALFGRERFFSVYGSGTVTRRLALPRRRRGHANVVVTAHSEDSVKSVRRTIGVTLR
jgi:hypothetical protein